MPDRFKDKKPLVRQKKVYDYFLSKGLEPKHAAALTGNFIVESGLNTTVEGDKNLKTPSQGLAQWRESRLDTLKNKYKDPYDLDNQLDFVWWELNNTHKSALKILKNSKTPEEAAIAVRAKYEVAWDGHDDRRIKNTLDVFNNFNSIETEQIIPVEQEVFQEQIEVKKDATNLKQKKFFTPETEKKFNEVEFEDRILKGVKELIEPKQEEQPPANPFRKMEVPEVEHQEQQHTFDSIGYELYRPEENEFLGEFLQE